jgi:alkylation response protein AidB-like acyl-CoA dehydrogenase
MRLADRGMGLGLRAVRSFAGAPVVDRLRIRSHAERALFRASRDGFRAAGTAGRTFDRVSKLGRPKRLKTTRGDLFDLTPSDEQQFLQEAFRDFATKRLRPAAPAADEATAAPAALLAEAEELGLASLGVPHELGGAVEERSSVTAVLAAEALAHGDMGLAVAALAPSGVATALALWGDGDQQGTYLPAFVADDGAPAAAVALMEPQPLFDPLAPATTAAADGGDYVLTGTKALVPRGAEAELLIVGARLEDGRPALFVVEAADGVQARPAPAMGLRAAATAELRLEGLRVPASALLADGDPAVYAEAVRRARLGWCALAAGTARAVLDHLIPYVNERTAFGEPIANRQAVAFAVADIAIELEGLRLVTLRAAARADAGDDFAREVALARALASEHGARIGSQGVQLLGGHGYVKEHPVERWYRDLRAVGLMEGGVLV